MRVDLLRAARLGKTVAYGTLMKKYRLSRGHALSRAIGEVDRSEYVRGAPGFAAIIVRNDTGFPGGGYFCDDELPARLRRPSSGASDSRLTAGERRYVRRQQRIIWKYYSRI